MKLKQFVYLGIIGFVWLLGTQPVKAQREEKLTEVSAIARISPDGFGTNQSPVDFGDEPALLKQMLGSGMITPDKVKGEATKAEVLITNIPQLSDIPRPHTSVKDLLAQEQQNNEVQQVTGVRLNQTKSGFEVILETRTSDKLQTKITREGNNFIADIPNAQLRLTGSNLFRADNPASDITTLTVTNQDTNSIRLTVTGKAGIPKVELFDSNEGLVFGVITAVASTQQQQQPQTPQTQKPSGGTPSAKPSTQGNEPIELLVTGKQEDSYSVPDATTATKIPVPILEVPQSIQAIPRQIIEDRQVVRIDQTSENVSGVQRITGGQGGISSAGFRIRGFSSGYENFRNGFRDYGFYSPRDIANVERIEFLKGPGSVLYGSTAIAGGLVNTVTKKPLDTPYYNANMTFGNYDFYRPTIDISGPLVADRSLLYRLNLAYENASSFRDFNKDESFFLAPALTWKINPRTNFTIELEHQDYNYTFDRGLPLVPQSLQLPINRFLGEPSRSDSNAHSTSITYNFDHQFSEKWKFRQGFNAVLDHGRFQLFDFLSLAADGQTLNRRAALSPNDNQENYSLQNEVFGEFKTGPLRHNILVGLELSRFSLNFSFFRAPLASINIFEPRYGVQPGVFTLQVSQGQGVDNLGAYLQDQIEILPNLKLLAGGRFDSSDSFYKDRLLSKTINDQSVTHFSPRVAIVYQPSKTTSLYFNWSNSFNPVFTSTSRTGEQFKPETGEQFEVGIKQSFLNDRLLGTLAFYDITRQNVLTQDPADRNFSIQTGEQESRGIDLDIAGQLLPGWKLIAAYSLIDASVIKDNRIPVGNRLVGVPENSASLWTTYEIQSGNLRGLGFGAGVVFAGKREVQLPNTFKLPSYFRTDAAIFYQHSNYRISLNINNLFDIKYYEVGTYINPGAPLTVLGKVSVNF